MSAQLWAPGRPVDLSKLYDRLPCRPLIGDALGSSNFREYTVDEVEIRLPRVARKDQSSFGAIIIYCTKYHTSVYHGTRFRFISHLLSHVSTPQNVTTHFIACAPDTSLSVARLIVQPQAGPYTLGNNKQPASYVSQVSFQFAANASACRVATRTNSSSAEGSPSTFPCPASDQYTISTRLAKSPMPLPVILPLSAPPTAPPATLRETPPLLSMVKLPFAVKEERPPPRDAAEP